MKNTKLTSVKILDDLYKKFKLNTINTKMTLQKLTNRSINLYLTNEKFKDNIVIGGLMLCKAPIELKTERTAYFKSQTDNQMRSVDNNLMRENDPRMPIFNERKSKVTFGKGN